MEGSIDKRGLVARLREGLVAELERTTRGARDAAEGATHEESRAEGDKDTRATEASYVARGRAARVGALERELAALEAMELATFAPDDPIRASAIVVLEQEAPRKGRTTYFLVTVGGGVRVETDGSELVTLTTTSPLGAALLGLSEGDDAEVSTPQGVRQYRIVRVR